MSTTIQLHKPQYNKHKHDIISDNIIANTIIIITNKVSQSHYTVLAIALEDNTNTKEILEIHQETLVQGPIRIFLVVQGATIAGRRDMSWQIVGISKEPLRGPPNPP